MVPTIVCWLSTLLREGTQTPVFPSPQKPTYDLIRVELIYSSFDSQSPQLVRHLCSARKGLHRAQQFDRQSALQTAQKDKNDRIPFTLTFHPHNHAVKSIILNNFKLL